jgi:hypothetical protein
MRSRLALLAVALVPLLVSPACKLLHKGADAGSDAATDAAMADEAAAPAETPSESPADAGPAAVHPSGPRHGPPAPGNACTLPKDTVACTPDGFEEVTCAGGVWKLLETCRGGCKGEGPALKCDPGVPRPGDACVAASAVPRCADAHSVLQCQNGHWTASLCVPPSKCDPKGHNGQPGCK